MLADYAIGMANVTVIHGDTEAIPQGVGTYASRSLQLGGVAVHMAALDVKEQARRVAAHLLEASEADLELDAETGIWQVRGDPATGQTWADVAGHAGPDGLAAAVEYTGGRPTFPFGTHLAVAEVDTETGKARLLRLMTVDDAGTVVNPVLAEGQRHGGIAQGDLPGTAGGDGVRPGGRPAHQHPGGLRHDPRGGVAELRVTCRETPRRHQPARGQGHRRGRHDRGRAATQNAVIDAVSHLGVRHIDMPATPPGSGPRSARRGRPRRRVHRGRPGEGGPVKEAR